jgi:hypothetical protein
MSKKKNAYRYNDPKYKLWREKVFGRDRYVCQLCGVKGKLNAHHIKKKSEYPKLAYVVRNGITLCVTCHEIVTGNEEVFEDFFDSIVRKKVTFDLIYRFFGTLVEKYEQIAEAFKAKFKWDKIFYTLGSKVKTPKKEIKTCRQLTQKKNNIPSNKKNRRR